MDDLERVGLTLQIVGLLVILGSQVWLWYRVHRKKQSLKEAFVSVSRPRESLGDRLDYNQGRITEEEYLKRAPLAKLLYDDFVVSVIGVILALIGTFLELFGSF